MFERYTEKARRAVFFARYEASNYGSENIDSEHLLLGLLRENEHLLQWIPKASPETIREWIEAQTPQRSKTSTSIDLPLSNECKTILKTAADEADRLTHRHIGTEHIFLAIFSVPDCLAAKLLLRAGAEQTKLRIVLKPQPDQPLARGSLKGAERSARNPVVDSIIEIHGLRRNPQNIRELVRTLRAYNWHWNKSTWKPRDVVINKANGRCSFDLSLAENAGSFMLVKGGWTKDHCAVCHWELFESTDEHGTGYTNGQHWLCLECYDKFWARNDFISGAYGEMT
ncbi:MAG TPA: Clp protease N-terminal domain-containing protein [Verrucomicrobiae bacterium]|nr:Clp protease N-terminal domain-containing protein [Verrucomicrobiae bacterium]